MTLPPQEREELRAEVIRECIAAIPAFPDNPNTNADFDEGFSIAHGGALLALEELLRDPAKELVEQWSKERCTPLYGVMDRSYIDLVRWLITTGKLQP